MAEQALAAQRQLALTVAGVATRQVDTAVDAVDTAVEAKPDRRGYEERSIEELRERARELEIEGRSTMSKDELIVALRRQSR